MIALTILSPILSPVLLTLLLAGTAPRSELHIDSWDIARTLLIAQLVPLSLGLGMQYWWPQLTSCIRRPLGLSANLLLLSVVALLLAQQRETLHVVRLRGWAGTLLLFAASLLIGWLCGGSRLAERKSTAITTAVRNAAVGLAIVSRSFPGSAAVTSLIVYTIVSILGSLAISFWLGIWAVAIDEEPR